MNNICLKSIDKDNPSSLATYEAMGGYKVWHKILYGELSPEKILEELDFRPKGTRWCWFSNGLKMEFYAAKSKGTEVRSL